MTYEYDSTKGFKVTKSSINGKPMLVIPVIYRNGSEHTLYTGIFRNYCIQTGWDENLTGDFCSSPNFNLRCVQSLHESDAKAIIRMAVESAITRIKGNCSIRLNPEMNKFVSEIYEYLVTPMREFNPDKRVTDVPAAHVDAGFDPDRRIIRRERVM